MGINLMNKPEQIYEVIIEGVSIIGWQFDPYQDCFTFVSGKAKEITGYGMDEWLKKGFWQSHIHPEDREFAIKYCMEASNKGKDHEFEYRFIKADGGVIWFKDIVQVVSTNGKVESMKGIFVDISSQKIAEENLKLQKNKLELKNIAMRELIGQFEFEKNQVRKNIHSNLKEFIKPIINKLKAKYGNDSDLKILDKNLVDIASSFGVRMSSGKINLTPKELQICNLIRNGFTNKEVAQYFNIACRTVEKHRNNIRNKLGLNNKRTNLASYLKTV